jgi:16S rRNA (cytidine1402-2'-O)-methyltransferase
MNTLYVVGMPAAHSQDLTLRARRVVAEALLVLSDEPDRARAMLADVGIDVPVAALIDGHDLGPALAAGDVALLLDGRRLGPDGASRRLVQGALEAGHPVVPVPGPALPLTALVVSGLPADRFVYLGELPPAGSERRDLLGIVAGEPRTLLALAGGARVASILADLHVALGDRPLVVVPAGGGERGRVWRGQLAHAVEDVGSLCGEACVLVVGGATEAPAAWGEARLDAEIERRAREGQGAKEISQALAAVSGWPRREIYRRAAAWTGTREDW